MDALRDGTIDAIATDHAPHTVDDKAGGFTQAAPGISCLETSFGLLMTALVHTGRIDLPTLLDRMTRGPAAIIPSHAESLGLRGLTSGATADIVILDPNRAWTVRSADFASKGKNTPLEGCELRGVVTRTFVGGREVYAAEPEFAGQRTAGS